MDENEFFEALGLLLRQIEIIPLEEYAGKSDEAQKLCKRDQSDWPFAALALKLNIPIWTSDPDLLIGQKTIPVMKTAELIQIFK